MINDLVPDDITEETVNVVRHILRCGCGGEMRSTGQGLRERKGAVLLTQHFCPECGDLQLYPGEYPYDEVIND